MRRYIGLALCVSLYIVAAFQALADCDHTSVQLEKGSKSWIKNDQLIYGLDKKGRLLETRLNSYNTMVLADHQFSYPSSFALSPDGKFIYYRGFSEPLHDFGSYLYNIQKGAEHELPESVSYSPDGGFSADSSYMLGIHAETLNIINTENGKMDSYPIPMPITETSYDRFVDPHWSLDGKAVYFVFIRHPEPEYYQYTIATGKFTKIEGFYEQTHYEHHFGSVGKEIETFRMHCMQWQCGGKELKSTFGDVAYIDEATKLLPGDSEYTLKLRRADGSIRDVEKGTYSSCSGVSLHLMTWLKDGKYFIYSSEGATYVYGVDENKKTRLFGSDVPISYFGWHE